MGRWPSLRGERMVTVMSYGDLGSCLRGDAFGEGAGDCFANDGGQKEW
jgi:hypothetical protein